MGLLVDGVWQDEQHSTRTPGGRFVRPTTRFRNWVTQDGGPGPTGEDGFAVARGRYHLYVALPCPWAHRTVIMRMLKGLEDVVSMSVLEPLYGPHGWRFGTSPGTSPDSVNGASELAEIYLRADPRYTGRVSVPALWDKERRTIVNNESAEIIRMLNDAFGRFTNVRTDYYPPALRAEIDRVNALVYENVNNGVYRAGFAPRRRPTKRRSARCSACSTSSSGGSRASATSWAQTSPKPTGGCSLRSCASTRSTTATSNATCAASSTIPISRITCATSISRKASPRP